MHSRYIRQLVDSAIGGRDVLVALRERRLFCDQTGEARALVDLGWVYWPQGRYYGSRT